MNTTAPTHPTVNDQVQRTISYAQQWEHRTEVVAKTLFRGKMNTSAIDQCLARLGPDGWELVQVLYDVNIAGARDGLLMFFKRPVRAT